ncbi:glycosyl hydrolase family 28-related protein [Persicobacter psychrovividus]|uniref:Rhamnogalacturonase A/B/Epimerase-like pectate lyase domain-containing protein n=1 Tax=Persicobacter psychrovividus TaxID=387638 RepID=A0ABN6L6B8_9BACT|nr:hypothetical protein PEPS_10130 [Persicobacter psychrovividus]
MRNFMLFLSLLISFPLLVSAQQVDFKPTPKVYPTHFPAQEKVIAMVNAADYGVLGNGVTDVTEPLQKVIDRLHNWGGGTVFLPRGGYRLTKQLVLRPGVTLRGDWRNPEDKSQKGLGTTLMIEWGHNTKGAPSGDDAAILMGRSAGLTNMAIWYPLQNFKQPVPYPWTIKQPFGNFATLENVTMINVWNGIKLGPRPNQFLTVKDLYMTALNMGFERDQVYDCARMHKVRISPKYWIDSPAPNRPTSQVDIAKFRQYLRQNVIGAHIGHYAWTWMYDWEIEDCKVGIRTDRSYVKKNHKGPNGGFVKLRLINNQIGMLIGDNNYQGWAVSDAFISSNLPNAIGVQFKQDFATIAQFNEVVFDKNLKNPVIHLGKVGTATFVNCEFLGHAEGGRDIDVKSGNIEVTQCAFKGEKDHVFVGPQTVQAQLLSNDFATKPDILNQAKNQYKVSINHDVIAYQSPKKDFQYLDERFMPATDKIFDVTDFGALGDGKKDCTRAFQRAMKAAKKKGGGTVFIPAGDFVLTAPVVVPSGVELRGTYEVPHHPLNQFAQGKAWGVPGSVIYAYYGKNEPDAPGLIQVESNASVRGFRVWYPQQRVKEKGFTPFAWTLQGLGPNVWMKDITFVNSYNGVDLGSHESTGHKVDFIAGCVLNKGLWVDQNKGLGQIKNVHFIGHFWSNSHYPGKPKDWKQDRALIMETLEAFTYGETENEQTLHTFVFGSKIGQHFVSGKNGRAANGLFVAHGTDESQISLAFDDIGDRAIFHNYQLVSMTSPHVKNYLKIGDQVKGKATFVNTLVWGFNPGPTTGIEMKSGHFQFEQINFTNHADKGHFGVDQTGGKLLMIAPRFRLRSEGPMGPKGMYTTGKYFHFGAEIDQAEIYGVFTNFPAQLPQAIVDESKGKVKWNSNIPSNF